MDGKFNDFLISTDIKYVQRFPEYAYTWLMTFKHLQSTNQIVQSAEPDELFIAGFYKFLIDNHNTLWVKY